MKTAIIGYSGSGKSTLSRFLGEKYGIPMLHFDTVHFCQIGLIRCGVFGKDVKSIRGSQNLI